jgi:Na+/proline symporter
VDLRPVSVIIAYLAVTTAVGIRLRGRARTAREWSVAGGGLGALMLAVGVAGTRVGGAGIYGVAGDVLRTGLWNAVWYAVATFLALALLGVFFAVPYRRLGLETVGEAFTIRFRHRRCQALTSLCVQAEYLVVNVIEAYVIGAMLRALTGMPLALGVALAASVLVSYTAWGGLWGAAATNLIHCAAVLAGLLAVAVLGLVAAGGPAALAAAVDQRLREAPADPGRWWSLAGGGALPIAAMLFSAAAHTPAASIYANFATAARDERTLVRGFLWAAGLAAVMPLLAGVVGMETLARFGHTEQLAGYVSVTRLAAELHPWVGGAALAAVFAAVVSTGGPVLLSSATMFVRDWLPRRLSASEGRLALYRLTTAVYGVIAAVLAWFAARAQVSLLELLLLGYAVVVPPAVAVAYLIYWRRTTEPGAFWGMLSGFLAGLLAYAVTRAAGSTLSPSLVTTLVPLVLVPAFSLLTRPEEEGEHAFRVLLKAR